MPRNDWSQYKALLLEAHEDNKKRFDGIDGRLEKMGAQLQHLIEREKTRAAFFGSIGGTVGAVLSAIITYFLSSHNV